MINHNTFIIFIVFGADLDVKSVSQQPYTISRINRKVIILFLLL